jgi:hypothetical protein
MKAEYYVGKYADDALNGPNRGWIVGSFMEQGPRNVRDVEVKYWEYPAGVTDHSCKESATFEVTFILQGETRARIADDEIILKAGAYVVIPPGMANNLVQEILIDAAGLTVKAPSDPSAKKIVS